MQVVGLIWCRDSRWCGEQKEKRFREFKILANEQRKPIGVWAGRDGLGRQL